MVDKPEGRTSHDVVLGARRALGLRRIGHTGTLDPFATGLLLLLLGPLTRLAQYFHLLPKTYEATLRLGAETDTEDRTGRMLGESDGWREVSPEAARNAFAGWVGSRSQIPPAFSAKRVRGRRAHEMARSGDAVELDPVPVTIQAIEVTDVSLPDIAFRATVSAGTYIRSLGRDVGRELGCGGHLTALRRTRIGPFDVSDAAAPGELATMSAEHSARRASGDAVAWMPRREVDEAEREELRHGRPIEGGELLAGWEGDGAPGDDLPVALLSGRELIAIARRSGGALRPAKVFAS